MTVKKITTLALFTTLALIIFTLESFLPPLVPIPGVKLGLANIITLVILRNFSWREASIVLIARILLSSFFYGQMLSLLYSLAGGILCLIIMVFVDKLLQHHSIYLTSIFGAISHNLGQLTVAYLITSTTGVWSYLPFLILSGFITGLFTGLCAHFTQRYLAPAITRLQSSPK